MLTFAGVGLRTNIREMAHQGVRPIAVGAIGEIFIAAVTLALVIGADRWVGLSGCRRSIYPENPHLSGPLSTHIRVR